MSKVLPKRINEKGLIALETVLGNFRDRTYTEKGFLEVFDHFSEDLRSKILSRLFKKQTESKQLEFLEKNNATKTQWDWLKFHFDKYWLTLVQKGVDTKVWKYVNKSVEELQKEGFDIDNRCGRCGKCSDYQYNKGEDDCINPRHKYFWLYVKHICGCIIGFRFDFSQGIDESYVGGVELYDLDGNDIGIYGHQGSNGKGKGWISAEEVGISFMLKSVKEFNEFMSELE